MFCVDDYIIYDGKGVCKVLDNNVAQLKEIQMERTYYKLSPIYETGIIYIPIDTDVFMRPVISKKDAEELIKKLPEIKEVIINHKTMAYLEKQYDDLLGTHDCENFFRVIKGLYLKKQKKKLGQVEERYMKRAENILYGELATSLGISRESVVPYIEETLSKNS